MVKQLTKIIWRRIRGRLVPINVAPRKIRFKKVDGQMVPITNPVKIQKIRKGKTVYNWLQNKKIVGKKQAYDRQIKPDFERPQFSADLRRELKRKISARTSLSMKRQKAIRAVSNTIKGRTKLIGEGVDLKVYGAGKNVVKVKREVGSFYRDNQYRLWVKHFLRRKKKLAPETFLVKTRNTSYLVQERGQDAGLLQHIMHSRKDKKSWNKVSNSVLKLFRDVENAGVYPNDLVPANAIVKKGRYMVSDAGLFDIGYRANAVFSSKAFIKKMKKFTITNKKTSNW